MDPFQPRSYNEAGGGWTAWEILKVCVVGTTLFPIRLVVFVLLILLTLFISVVGTFNAPTTSEPFGKATDCPNVCTPTLPAAAPHHGGHLYPFIRR